MYILLFSICIATWRQRTLLCVRGVAGRRLVALDGERRAALLLGKVRGLGSEKLGGEVVGAILVIGGAALARTAVLELCVRGEEALVVGRAAEGFLATGLRASKLDG